MYAIDGMNVANCNPFIHSLIGKMKRFVRIFSDRLKDGPKVPGIAAGSTIIKS